MCARLADRPGVLLAVCFALNAVFMPYAGMYHDARLYAAQVVQAGTGELSNDLFFKYGSQSQYTLFPNLLAAAADKVGVELVFFVAYLLCNALRLWAIQRLAFRVAGPGPAAAAVLMAAVAPLWWGRMGVFSVNEWFFTARVPAVALAILGLDRLLAGRPWAAAALLAAATVVHPLVAGPAVAIAVGWGVLAWARTPRRRALVAVGGAAGVAAVGWYLARTAGTLDAEWRELTFERSPHIDPRNWRLTDFIRLALGAGCALALARTASPAVRRVLVLAVVAAALGVAGGVAVCMGTWAVPFQIQPVRGVWPLELLRLPVGLAVVARLWAGGPSDRLIAVALFAGLVPGPDLLQPGSAPLFAVLSAVGIILVPRLGPVTDGGTLWRGLAVGLAGWAEIWYVGVLPAQDWILIADGEVAALPLAEQVELLFNPFGPFPRFVVALPLVALALRLPPRAAVGAAVAAGLAAATAAYAVPRLPAVAERVDPLYHDTRFVRDYLASHPVGGRRPAVYWPGVTIDLIWMRLHSEAYFHLGQLSGNLFARPTAIEGKRRADLVALFEIEQIRQKFPRNPKLSGEDLGAAIDLPPPTIEAFRELLAEPNLDIVVLPSNYGGAAATNGSVWIYDARKPR